MVTEQSPKVNRRNLLVVAYMVVTVVGAILIFRNLADNLEQHEQLRKDTVCPSLLSIARSSRDTLIVMKNEPLCATFVLDSLQ